MRIFSIPFFLAATILAGCAAPSTAPKFSEAPSAAVREDMAVLYIYREYAEPTAWSPTIYIDGKEVVSLPQQGFSWVYLPAGQHILSSKWSFLAGVRPIEFAADYKNGTRYFFEIIGTSRMTGSSPGYPGVTMHFKTTAQVRSSQEYEAVQQLQRCCRFIKPSVDTL